MLAELARFNHFSLLASFLTHCPLRHLVFMKGIFLANYEYYT
jgi:hypothetical protein